MSLETVAYYFIQLTSRMRVQFALEMVYFNDCHILQILTGLMQQGCCGKGSLSTQSCNVLQTHRRQYAATAVNRQQGSYQSMIYINWVRKTIYLFAFLFPTNYVVKWTVILQCITFVHNWTDTEIFVERTLIFLLSFSLTVIVWSYLNINIQKEFYLVFVVLCNVVKFILIHIQCWKYVQCAWLMLTDLTLSLKFIHCCDVCCCQHPCTKTQDVFVPTSWPLLVPDITVTWKPIQNSSSVWNY